MDSFCFTGLNYSIVSVASILIKCMKPALNVVPFFLLKKKQEGFFKDALFFSE